MPSLSPISVSVMPHRSSRRYQSALLRARRETSRPSTIPIWPKATSAVMRANPERLADPEPDKPRSSSMTITCSLAHPSSHAFSTKAYWRAVDSRSAFHHQLSSLVIIFRAGTERIRLETPRYFELIEVGGIDLIERGIARVGVVAT